MFGGEASKVGQEDFDHSGPSSQAASMVFFLCFWQPFSCLIASHCFLNAIAFGWVDLERAVENLIRRADPHTHTPCITGAVMRGVCVCRGRCVLTYCDAPTPSEVFVLLCHIVQPLWGRRGCLSNARHAGCITASVLS